MPANVKYQPLAQSTGSEEEDEGFDDNILYDSRLVKPSTMDRRNVFELERLGETHDRPTSTSVRYPGRTRKTCLLVAVLLVILLGALAAVLFPLLNHALNHGLVTETHLPHPGQDWTRQIEDAWTESNPKLIDVDGDGYHDILLGLVDKQGLEIARNGTGNLLMSDYCKIKGREYPCGSEVLALRGDDGKDIWRVGARSVVLYQTCNVDVNGDGSKECVVTGRRATCQALNLKTGKNLWVVDPDKTIWSKHFVSDWVVFQALTLPDLDQDGVHDILILQSPDKTKEVKQDNSSSRLILLSGSSGKPIGDYVSLPNNRQSNVPPVLYKLSDDVLYILIGTGDRTNKGDLLAVSVLDIYRLATTGLLKVNKGAAYNWLDPSLQTENGFTVLLSTQEKGVLTPPVLTDVDGDGHIDVLVTSFDGNFTLLDGKSLSIKWTRKFSGYEAENVPAPGYFNFDDQLDFMVQINKGKWNKYNSSKTVILNGKDGSTLWTVESQRYTGSSALSLKTLTSMSDTFLVNLVGRNLSRSVNHGNITFDLLKNFYSFAPGALPNRNYNSTEEFQLICHESASRIESEYLTCNNNLSSLTHEVFLIDSESGFAGLRILQHPATRFRYQVEHTPGNLHCHSLSQRHKDKIDMCVVLTPVSYTGSIGDVDGDSMLDYVHVTQSSGIKFNDRYQRIANINQVLVTKFSLIAAIKRKDVVILDQKRPDSFQTSNFIRHLDSIGFQPVSKQQWTQFMGTDETNLYLSQPP